jgi:hypothetical protein
LSDKDVISKVSRNFVPVALNLYQIRKARGTAGEFFAKVVKQRPAQYQGLYVVTAEAKVLANRGSQPSKGTWEKDTLKLLDEGLEAFGDVTPRKVEAVDPNPERGVGVGKDGGIVLAVYARPMVLGLDRRGLGEVAIDRVALTKDEQKSLTLPAGVEEATWTVPAKTVEVLHRVLSPSSDTNTMARRDEVTKARLRGKIERINKGVAYLSYDGTISGVHTWEFAPHKGKKIKAEVALRGVGTAESKTGKLQSITLVGDGRYRNYPPYDDESKYGAVVEWRLKAE